MQRYKFLLIFHEILAKFKLSFYLCAINIYVMEEKRFPNIVDGRLQVTPDIEEEIAEVERGETVSMSEFNMMFAKWLD